MASEDKGKRKIIQPTQSRRSSSPMNISSDEDEKLTVNTATIKTEKLLQSAIKAAEDYSFPKSIFYNPVQGLKPRAESSKNRIPIKQKPQTITFGNYSLPICTEDYKKFRPLGGLQLTEEQQCLLDNLWHIQTIQQASGFKVQVLNALGYYFHENFLKSPNKTQKKFSHYVIFRGIKIGIFNKWETVAKFIQCPNPIYKGFYSFQEAITTAREHFGTSNFFIEPEEVKSFSETVKTNPEQIIKNHEELIATLQKQLVQSGKSTNYVQLQAENSILKQQIKSLEAKNTQLSQRLEKNTNTVINRDFNSFKARLLDLPWRQTMQPILEKFNDLEQIISQKICTEFPSILYELQLILIKIAFKEIQYKAVNIVERADEGGDGTGLLLLQVNLLQTDMPHDQILQFYHYGMIDYLEFRLTPTIEELLNRFGEKFVMVAGNISNHIFPAKVGCKIFASLPEADSHTYRPSRKRIFISHRTEPHKKCLQNIGIILEQNINFSQLYWLNYKRPVKDNDPRLASTFVQEHQRTANLPLFSWDNSYHSWEDYKLLAEGHYTQIWAHKNWNMLLPFTGEGDMLQLHHITNDEDIDSTIQYLEESDTITIDSTHRDF